MEIMAPAGNFECLRAAIQGGADSIYFGVDKLNMRSHSANNFSTNDLPEIARICEENGVRSYLTLNIIIYNADLEEAYKTLDAAKEANITAVIASDMAIIMYAFSIGLEVHISTQLNVSNIDTLRFFAQFADVIVLARELDLKQVKQITDKIKEENICGPAGRLIEIEMFCHGALCMAISGKCYLSLHEYNLSANRGSCIQLCRRAYSAKDLETDRELEIDNKYIMSPKDLCTVEFVDKMIEAGVSVFKIEGRARAAEYVKTVCSVYRSAIDAATNDIALANNAPANDIAGESSANSYTDELKSELKEKLSGVFNRGFWDGYYQGAKLGEWSEVYGNKATRRKTYIGKVTNYFSNIGVAEVLLESGDLSVGQEIMIMGPSTGLIEHTVEEIRVDLKKTDSAVKGTTLSIPIAQKLRRSDKIYVWLPA